MLESIFNEIADMKACSIIKKKLQHSYFTANISKFLRAPVPKNICERLLMYIWNPNCT